DKWSLFPVPLITQNGQYFSRGLLLYENNFLGRLGTFAPGVFWTNSGLNALIYWQEDNIISKTLGMKVILLHKNDLTQFERKGNIVKEFESRLDSIILTPNYQHGNFDHKLGPIFLKREIFEGENRVFRSKRYGLYYRQHYRGFQKLPVLFDGLDGSFDLFFIPKGSEYDFLTGGDLEYLKPVGNDFFHSRIHFNYTNNDSYLSPKILGGNEGYRGYDRESLPTQWNYGGLLEFKKHLFNTVYSSVFYEYNYSKLIKPVLDGAKLSESTVGINAGYFFQKVSIPAFICEYAYNVDDQSHHVLVNVGLQL
ncbi:MAG: hypothetical protein K9K67_15080, partial [Bacteriovoracaceae bacterium]|nr:hypothetical protein [Bacteriovoracaceae bacterium]